MGLEPKATFTMKYRRDSYGLREDHRYFSEVS